MRLQTKIILSVMPVILVSILFLALWSANSITGEVERNFYYEMDEAVNSYLHEQLNRRKLILEKNSLQNVSSFVALYQRNALQHAEKHLLYPGDRIIVFDEQNKVLADTAKSKGSDLITMILNAKRESGSGPGDTVAQGAVEWQDQHLLFVEYYYSPWKWKVLYLRHTSQLSEKIRTIYTVYAVVAGLIILAVNLAVFFVLRYFYIKPVMLLNEATEKIGSNEQFGAIGVSSRDELGALARQMEKMATRIDRYADVQKRLQDDAMDSKERLQLIIDSAQLGTWEWDIRTGRLILNSRWAESIGYELSELMPSIKILEQLVHPEDYQIVAERISEHVAGVTQVFTAEYRLKHRKGHWVWVLAVGRVLRRDNEGKGIYAVGIQIDIGKQKAAEEKLRNAMVRAEAANKAKLAFLSNISHELRTPLNAILGYAQLLQVDRQLGEKQRSGIETISQAGEHLLMLINDILDFSHLESGNLELVEKELALKPFLTGIRDIMAIRCHGKGLDFHCDLSADLPEIIVIDGHRLKQVLLNLLNNAIKFTETGYCRLKVTCSNDTPERVRLSFAVEDSGIGITPDLQKKVFEPFQQNEDRLKYIEGTGLGLAICQYLVRQMGGELLLISPLHSTEKGSFGPGSCFTFSLFCQAVWGRGSQPAFRVSDPDATLDGRGRRILVIDDQLSSRMLLQETLKLMKFDVRVEESAVNIVGVCYEYQPDLVMLDMRMPVIDGAAALSLLKNDSGLSTLPVIAISASSVDQQGRPLQIANSGFAGYLLKPYRQVDLIELLVRHLNVEVVAGTEKQTEKTGEKVEMPPKEIITSFLAHLNSGNMDAIIDEANVLAQQSEGRYSVFAYKLKKLAVDVQMAAIEKLLSGKYESGGK